jgi:hypothetical protein
MGKADIVPLPETLKTQEGELAEGGAFLSFGVDRSRTGVIQSDILFKGAYGGDQVIPAGTKVYGVQYSLMTGSTYTPMTNANRLYNPIEWCTAPEKGTVQCLFWQNETQVKVIDAYGPALIETMITPSGMPAPMPLILEQDVDFGVTVSMDFRVERLRRNHISIAAAMTRSDGSSRRMDQRNIPWNAERKAIAEFFGGKFEFTAQGEADKAPTGVSVAILAPPDPERLRGGNVPDDATVAALIEQLQETARQEQATKQAAEGAAETPPESPVAAPSPASP